MKRLSFLVILWFACGYFASAMWTANFYGEFGSYGVETRGSAARSSLFYFILGPIGATCSIMGGTYKPMWDWPRYLLDDYKSVEVRP